MAINNQTLEQDIITWLNNHIDVELVKYGGGATFKSEFRCKKDGHIWSTCFFNMKSNGSGCPICGDKKRAKYIYNDVSFDSSWELIFYFYHKQLGNNIKRLDKSTYLLYEYIGKIHRWYPDFKIESQYYEIKPDAGNRFQKDTLLICDAKKKAYPDVIWAGDKDIKMMQKCIDIDIKQYRIDKKIKN